MTKEENLRKFYKEIKNLSEEKRVNCEVAFLEMICTLFLGETLNKQEDSIYEYLLVWNLTYDEYKRNGLTDKALEPFHLIDKRYYQALRQKYNTNTFRIHQTFCIGQLIKDLSFDEESITTRSLKKANPEIEKNFKAIKQIIKEVKENSSIAIEAINLLALSSAYFRLYNTTLNKKQVEEKILANKIEELGNKKKSVSKIIVNIENSSNQTKEEKFVSVLENLVSILNSALNDSPKKEELFEKITENEKEWMPLLELLKNE